VDAAVVAEKHADAAAAWPGVALPFAVFDRALREALAAGTVDVDDVHTRDLYLALACLAADPRAIAALDRHVIAPIKPSVERACRDGLASSDDVLQWTREKLLLGGDGGPKLGQYAGRGPLVGWVRVVAVREALQDRRRSKRERARDDAAVLDGGPPATGMEVVLLRQRYAASFREAVQASLRRLSPEQRTLLRLHTHERLTIDELAPILGVHRATAARRLDMARADALLHTRAILRERHGLSDSEVGSVCAALAGEVDVSIGRALAGEEA
jgi:RNA polymerase sigma-70 factor (ECF subfamily)